MELKFNIVGILEHQRYAEACKAHRTPYSLDSATPGFWIVGDRGVYIMSNGRDHPDGIKVPEVVYAEGCNPKTDEDWYDVKLDTFGGDDGCEDILEYTAQDLELAIDRGLTHLAVLFEEGKLQLELVNS